MKKPFIELLHVSLGTRDKLSCTPSDVEWSALFSEAQKQAIIGVMLGGLERLPKEQLPKQNLLLQWIGLAQMNDGAYKIQCKRAKELTNMFAAQGVKSCVLKGLGIAQLYPRPSMRQCGDIDLWIDGKRNMMTTWMRNQYAIDHSVWHHVDAKFFEDVETEIHFHPGWLYNYFMNLKLQHWFKEHQEQQMMTDENLGFAYPTVRFNGVYALVHLYHHLIEEGVGIRHVVDYFYILKALSSTEKMGVVDDLKNFGMLKLAKAMMWVLIAVCGMSSEYLLCEPDEKEGRFLFDEMMRGGNFGHYRKDNRQRNSISRMMALLPHYPNEVLWVVPWKLWHRCWRWFNR